MEKFIKQDSGVQEKHGLNYKVELEIPIFVGDTSQRVVTFSRTSTWPGKGYEEKIIALVEYI